MGHLSSPLSLARALSLAIGVCHPIETSSNKQAHESRDAKPLENTATAPTSSLFAARRLSGPIFMVAGKRNVVHAGLGVQQTHENSGLPTTHRRVQLNHPPSLSRTPPLTLSFYPLRFCTHALSLCTMNAFAVPSAALSRREPVWRGLTGWGVSWLGRIATDCSLLFCGVSPTHAVPAFPPAHTARSLWLALSLFSSLPTGTPVAITHHS